MLEKLIIEEIGSKDMEVGLVVKDLREDGWTLQYNEENIFPSASIIKILIMVEAFQQIEEGKFTKDEKILVEDKDKVEFSIISELKEGEYTLIDLITWMIIVSDNTATNVLIDLLGYENINNMAKSLGCKNTLLQRKMMDFNKIKLGKENLTTPLDMGLILDKIYHGEILSEDSCSSMLNILRRQRVKDRLLRYIVRDEALANKTGELEGINHDIGIFFLENVDYLIGVFTKGGEGPQDRKRTIGKISKLVYNHYRGDIFENR